MEQKKLLDNPVIRGAVIGVGIGAILFLIEVLI